MHFVKGTETNCSYLASVNEIEDVSSNETEDKDTPIHTGLSDLKINIHISD